MIFADKTKEYFRLKPHNELHISYIVNVAFTDITAELLHSFYKTRQSRRRPHHR